MPTTTVAAIVKNERPYLLEWVAWYRLLGFDHIVIYSNDCTDGTGRLLDAIAAAGLVSHRPWPSEPGRTTQVPAYMDIAASCETDWLLFVDADELLHFTQDRTIGDFLARFPEDVGAIAINWRIFGSSGHLTRGAEPVVARFTRAGPREVPTMSGIARRSPAPPCSPSRISTASSSKAGRYVDSEGRDIEIERMGFTPTVEHRLAQLNHYRGEVGRGVRGQEAARRRRICRPRRPTASPRARAASSPSTTSNDEEDPRRPLPPAGAGGRDGADRSPARRRCRSGPLTGGAAESIWPALAGARRLKVRLRTLTPSIEVQILAGHPNQHHDR